uniref:Uncharacterized protein n=1 Tax=viral metagenome TaxID=1070528 RepID=A0A6H1ZFQ8_9ZZZZ
MQTACSFDKDTLIKIGKGALIAASGAAALYILNILGTIQLDSPLFASFMVWFIPVATNTIKEWIKGNS